MAAVLVTLAAASPTGGWHDRRGPRPGADRGARARGWRIATAESCTGGLVAAALTDIPGSSDVFDRGFVTYSYPAKVAMLGVPQLLLTEHGAVSEPVARAMAEGALAASDAELAVAVTGVAGPGAPRPSPRGWSGSRPPPPPACGPSGATSAHRAARGAARSVETALELALALAG